MVTLGKLKLVGIDSNIFIYYFEENPQFGRNSKQILDALSTKVVSGVTSILTLTETLSKKGLPDNVAADLEKSFFDIPHLSILEVSPKIAVEAARIRRKYRFRLADSIQIATALQAKAKAFITNDERLKKFTELKVILLSEIR